MLSLKGKVVFITGASSGIGKAAAIKFAEAEARLILCARRKEHLKKLSQTLSKEYGVECVTFPLDVRNQKNVQKAIDKLPDEWKEIDILVNNAGLSRGLEKIQDGVISNWEEMIDTNIKGLLYVTRAILPGMVARNRGHIVNLGSIAGHEVYVGGNVYCATKFAITGLSRAIRLDLFGTKIRVTTISPGMVETEFALVRFHGEKMRAEQVYKGMTPLSGNDIAEAILFACSRPGHVNINEIIIMPTDQSAISMVNRK